MPLFSLLDFTLLLLTLNEGCKSKLSFEELTFHSIPGAVGRLGRRRFGRGPRSFILAGIGFGDNGKRGLNGVGSSSEEISFINEEFRGR